MRPPRLENLVLCLGIGFFGRGELPALPLEPSTRDLNHQESDVCLGLPTVGGEGPCSSVELPGRPSYSEQGEPRGRGKRSRTHAAVTDDHGGVD